MRRVSPFELGQSAAKAVTDDTKKNLRIAQGQITGKPVQQRGTNGVPIQPKAPDATKVSDTMGGDFSSLLEQNQTQQNPSASQKQDPVAQQKLIEEKFSSQQKEDQAKIAAARKNLQELEEEMKKLRLEREQKQEQEKQVEEQKEEQEELWKKEEEKKQPISAGQRSGEVKGNKG